MRTGSGLDRGFSPNGRVQEEPFWVTSRPVPGGGRACFDAEPTGTRRPSEQRLEGSAAGIGPSGKVIGLSASALFNSAHCLGHPNSRRPKRLKRAPRPRVYAQLQSQSAERTGKREFGFESSGGNVCQRATAKCGRLDCPRGPSFVLRGAAQRRNATANRVNPPVAVREKSNGRRRSWRTQISQQHAPSSVLTTATLSHPHRLASRAISAGVTSQGE